MASGGSALQGVGILGVAAGSWLLYATVTNQAPVQTLVAILKDPANARSILAARGLPISTGSLAGVFGSGVNSGEDIASAEAGASSIVAFARAQIGKPYQSPGDSLNTWDCSGLTKAAVKAGTGLDLPHSATAQQFSLKGATVAAKANLQPGDIVFPSVGHCGVVTGKNTMIDAPSPGKTVRERDIYGFLSAKRFTMRPRVPETAGKSNV